jgi:asparagine synthase (glutamine-hydrolysing)
MCGIAGIIGPDANETLLLQILKPISHRGEESYRNEILVLPNAAIGAHRLAIVDESNGKQPKQFLEQNVFSVFNGEIYNHAELKKELSLEKSFLSNCDSEAVLHAYLKWGEDFVHYLDGKFAVAIYDNNNNTLILARDPMGIKPLYYAQYRKNIVFSSELKSLVTIADDSMKIFELEPGAIWKNGVVKKYFNLGHFSNHHTNDLSFTDYLPKLKTHLIEAVRKRIPKDSPRIACLLSGGIDSTIITYIASKLHPHVVAYTLAAPNMPSADLEAATAFCKQFNIEHIIVSPKVKEMQDFYLQEGAYMTESFEPILIRNAVSYNFLCRKVREDGFKYCLNGEGADELFGGYDFVREAPTQQQDDVIWHSLSIIHRTYLQMADRASMYTTIEARVPYMDKELVDLCLSLPIEARIHGDNNKVILRKLFEGELPDSLNNRRKVGMNEGSGFGVNASQTSIYFDAVKNYYEQYPKKYNDDLALCRQNAKDHTIDLTSIEEVFHFAKLVMFSFTKLVDGTKRLQLNTKLKPELVFPKEECLMRA